MFCPKCGSLLFPKKLGKKITLSCTNCNYRSEDISVAVRKEIVNGKKDINIVDESFETEASTDAKCPKCSHGKAFYWLKQTRAADEAPTKFFKCIKCGHRWREYN